MTILKRALSVILVLLLVLVPCIAEAGLSRAGRTQAADSDYDGIPDEFDIAPNSNTFTGQMKSGHDGTTTVSFTMDFRSFFGDGTVYHPDLATVSVMGSALAYYVPDYGTGATYFTYDTAQTWAGGTASKVDGMQLMQVLGFEDVKDFTLDSYGDDDICEMVIGHRTVEYGGESKIVVAMWVRGTEPTSQEEWSSNFHVGDLVRFFDAYDSAAGKSPRQSNDDWTRKTNHRGFDVCATRLLRYLDTYYLDEFVDPELDADPALSLTFWLTGHSRGAAVANLMASYLIDRGEDVRAYTFAAPYNTANTEASAEKYDCIFNLVNSNDFVPMLPMTDWGFTRFGKTANVDASRYSSLIKTATGETYDGNYLTASDMNTLLGKFICITGENADRDNPGKILGWREVYVYHCGHDHADETNGNYQSTTFCKKQSITNWGGPTESGYNGYAVRLRKYSYWNDGICETPAYCMQVLVELMVAVANGETLSGASTFITSNKLADKFDFDKWSLISYATKLTEPHFMDTYSVIQAQINQEGDPGARFTTLGFYTASGQNGGRPIHTHTYTYVPYEGHEPTCTEEGFGYRCCLCSEVNSDYYDDYQKNVPIPALGHEWGEPSFEWTADNASCTAARVCTRDSGHTETETAASVYSVVTEPTFTSPGVGRYTVVFQNEAFGERYVEVEIPKLVGFTVTFLSWDGTVLSVQTVEAGGAATAPEPPERDGYSFVGWDGDFSNVNADITITALYERNALPGDVNCDGAVDFEDVTILSAYIVGSRELTGQGLLNADFDGVDGVQPVDISFLYNYLMNN
ncbi:MAG: InlB B-repeat-containing protein [Clostridia bacterium]|nr:InlB B-repeat-containing protein [Clostridia bacterium]